MSPMAKIELANRFLAMDTEEKALFLMLVSNKALTNELQRRLSEGTEVVNKGVNLINDTRLRKIADILDEGDNPYQE